MKYCKDCEPSQKNHIIAYTSVLLGYITNPLLFFIEKHSKKIIDSLLQKIELPFLKILLISKIANLSMEPDERDSDRTKCIWKEAQKREIDMREIKIGKIIKDIFIAQYKNKTIIFSGLPRISEKESDSINWMDDKNKMRLEFKKQNIPVASGGMATNINSALNIYRKINKPVITKPNLGSRSRHTTINIKNEAELIVGFKKANILSPFVIIEEELSGSLFRGTLINKKLVGVVRRDPPLIIGNGKNTVEELITLENERKERKGPIFHTITINKDVEKELENQNLKLKSIPQKNLIVRLSQKTSRGIGGTTTEMTNVINVENKKLLEKIGEFLNDPLVGVDFIMTDITIPWQEQKNCGIIECNSCPFIDLHHYPLFGEPNNVAGKLWDDVFPLSKTTKI